MIETEPIGRQLKAAEVEFCESFLEELLPEFPGKSAAYKIGKILCKVVVDKVKMVKK